MRRFTLVSFHAHPDDEALLTSGTLARASSEGHRVVLVVATDGEAGLTSSAVASEGPLGPRRRAEVEASAAALGVARVVHFGFPDSGWPPGPSRDPRAFGALDPARVASPLVDVLREERADVLTTYDPAGGYGHPDHRQVHVAGAIAARLASTPGLLEATVDRTLLRRAVRAASLVPRLIDPATAAGLANAYAPRAEITHCVDVRAFTAAKRASMQAHVSQTGTDRGTRTLELLLRLPGWLFDRVLGREWFVDRSRAPGRCDDVFAGVRGRPDAGIGG